MVGDTIANEYTILRPPQIEISNSENQNKCIFF